MHNDGCAVIRGSGAVQNNKNQTRKHMKKTSLALAAQTQAWRSRLLTRNGTLLQASTADDPVQTVRNALDALGGRA